MFFRMKKKLSIYKINYLLRLAILARDGRSSHKGFCSHKEFFTYLTPQPAITCSKLTIETLE